MTTLDLKPDAMERPRLAQMVPWGTLESIFIPVLAVIAALVPFGIFLAFSGANPFTAYKLMFVGAFGSTFSLQNTLTRAAPLMLTGLCTALPMRLGMVVIGGEGALVMGGLMAAGAAHLLMGASPLAVQSGMIAAGFLAGGIWIMIPGLLKLYRGVNETISSLLLIYIAVAILNHMVEGPWRDPESLNKPSSWPIGDDNMLGVIPGIEVHYGLLFGVIACIIAYLIFFHTTFGFSARVIGGNLRAAKVAGLAIAPIVVITCLLAGGAAGVAGAVEVAAIQGAANSSITVAGYGYTGILVAFLARQNPIMIIPVAVLLGGISASNGLLQRRLGLPDATVLVLQGMIFLVILASESYYGRMKMFRR